LHLRWIGEIGSQIDPGLQAQEPARRIGDFGEQDRNDRKSAPGPFGLGLAIQSELDLAALPSPQAGGPDEDNNGTAGADGLLERGEPLLAGAELIAIEEGGDTRLSQPRLNLSRRFRVGTAVAQEDIEGLTDSHAL
jgi:hypothetical protein